MLDSASSAADLSKPGVDVISTSSAAVRRPQREAVLNTLKDDGAPWLVELQESERRVEGGTSTG